jgi:hypothetical protein
MRARQRCQLERTRPALRILGARVKKYGPATLWAGAFATAAANFVGSLHVSLTTLATNPMNACLASFAQTWPSCGIGKLALRTRRPCRRTGLDPPCGSSARA